MTDVYNSAFRDNAANSSYPLDSAATQTVLPPELLLDASLYVPSSYKPPFMLLRVDGGAPDDAVRFVIGDANRREVCAADCLYTRGSAVFLDTNGRSMGVLVYDQEAMASFKGDVGAKAIEFVQAESLLQSECVRFYDPKGLHTVSADNKALTNLVGLAFTAGLQLNNTGGIDAYGEHEDATIPIKTINGIEAEHVFILSAVHPNYDDESALRVETAGTIKIGKSRDF